MTSQVVAVDEAVPPPPCAFTSLFGGPRIGPSVFSASYQLALNAGDHLTAAYLDVATWADRLHHFAVLRAAGPFALNAAARAEASS